jgi:hypothetical protein
MGRMLYERRKSCRQSKGNASKDLRGAPRLAAATSARESWRMFGIMAEFVEATERLATIRPAVSIFGSARIAPDHPYYA